MSNSQLWTYMPLRNGLIWHSTGGDRSGEVFLDPANYMSAEAAAEHALLNLLAQMPPEIRKELDGYEIGFSEFKLDQRMYELAEQDHD